MILPSITTLGIHPSTWQSKINELANLKLPQVALFLTGLSNEDRLICLSRLKKLRRFHSFQIPFVHAVSAMKEEEYLFLMDNFGTEQFNLHPVSEYPLIHELGWKVRERIAIENANCARALESKDLDGFQGVCIDLSHLEETRYNHPAVFEQMAAFLSRVEVRANHIGAVRGQGDPATGKFTIRSEHVALKKDDFTYLLKYSTRHFSKFCAIEVENSLAEQLEFAEFMTERLVPLSSSDTEEKAA